jgi:uncharacterized protein YecT (DUF1311 family)
MTALAAWVIVAAAAAGGGTEPNSFDACMQRAGGVTAAMHDCIAADLRAHDERLNTAYAALRADLAAERRTALLKAQRDWLRFRDSNCALRLDAAGGTLAAVAAGDCRRRMTRDRADELEALRPPR